MAEQGVQSSRLTVISIEFIKEVLKVAIAFLEWLRRIFVCVEFVPGDEPVVLTRIPFEIDAVADFATDDAGLRDQVLCLLVLAEKAPLRIREIWPPDDLVLYSLTLIEICDVQPTDSR